MAKRGNVDYQWKQNLTSGMDQVTNPNLVENNESPHLQNVSLDKPGVWATRTGSDLIGASLGSNQGYGLFTYLSNTGTRKLLAVTDRDLFALTEPATWGAAVDTDEWPADKRVDGVNFLNRFYMGSEDGGTPLQYTTGGAVTEVTPEIGGSILAVHKSILALGGNDIKPNVIFYTDPFTHNFAKVSGTCAANADVAGANTVTATTGIFEPDMIGAILYNETLDEMNFITGWTSSTVVTTDASTATWDDDTISVLQNNFTQDNACTGMIGFQEQFISFDENKMYMWDPTSNWSKDIGNYGCVNYRTVKVLDGLLIWANRKGIWVYGGDGKPTNVIAKIRDKVNALGLWDLIDDANWGSICAGVDPGEGKYYLSVGTLKTVSGASASAITNVVIVFDVNKGTIVFRNYPDQIVAFTNFVTSDGTEGLYGICKTDAMVVKLNTGTTDDDATGTPQSISYDIRSPHHSTGSPFATSNVVDYLIRYISTSTITLAVSVNRGSYATLATLPASSTVRTIAVRPKANHQAFTHGLRFTGTGLFQLEGYGFAVKQGRTTRVPRK